MSTKYKISARPREEFPGFWRSGIFFPNAPQYIILDEKQVTPSILSEPMLICEKIEGKVEKNNGGDKDKKAGGK